MAARKKPQKPKRLFSKKSQSRRAPPSLHYEEQAPKRRYYEFDEANPDVLILGDLKLPLKVPNVAPQAPPGTDPVDVNEYGMLKMSVVLIAFAEPFLDADLSFRELTSFYMMASFAWNLALDPEADVRGTARPFLKQALRRATPEVLDDALDVVEAMVQRKHDYFESDRRGIGDLKLFPLLDPPGDYHLSVISVLEPMEPWRRRSWISRPVTLLRVLFRPLLRRRPR